MIHNLNEKAMLVNLTLSLWTARRHDERVSQEVAVQHKVKTDNAGRYNKKLAQGSVTYEQLRALVGAARNFHYAHTLPWTNEGERILPAAGYMKWAGGIRQFKQEIDTLADKFAGEFEALKVADKDALNGLYRDRDYPDDVRGCFAIRSTVRPLPLAGDFRVSLSSTEIELIRGEIERDTQKAVADASQEVWGRLYRVVSHVAEVLQGKDNPRVFDSLIGNVKELADLLPSLNLGCDPNLEAIGTEIKAKLAGVDTEELRGKDAGAVRARADVAAEAERIQKSMAVFMGKGA